MYFKNKLNRKTHNFVLHTLMQHELAQRVGLGIGVGGGQQRREWGHTALAHKRDPIHSKVIL